jgi:flagellar biosynthesis protein FlhF
MKIQRYLAKDMRSALTQVREALGPDAVILSTGRMGEEVEVVAAIDRYARTGRRQGICPNPTHRRLHQEQTRLVAVVARGRAIRLARG